MCIQVIPEPGSLIGDLLSMDLGGGGGSMLGGAGQPPVTDLLGGGLDQLLGGSLPDTGGTKKNSDRPPQPQSYLWR